MNKRKIKKHNKKNHLEEYSEFYQRINFKYTGKNTDVFIDELISFSEKNKCEIFAFEDLGDFSVTALVGRKNEGPALKSFRMLTWLKSRNDVSDLSESDILDQNEDIPE